MCSCQENCGYRSKYLNLRLILEFLGCRDAIFDGGIAAEFFGECGKKDTKPPDLAIFRGSVKGPEV
jgi:hypothetical protein